MIWGLALLALAALAWWLSEYRRWPMGRAARAEAPGKFAELSQGQTHYRWDGPRGGPVAVCVHGLSSASYVYDALVRALTVMGFRVLRYDLYGRGYSDRPGGRQDTAFFQRQLEELLSHEGVEQADLLMGYSMGGSIATAFAAAHPMRVLRLVLLAPAGLGHDPGRMGRLVAAVPVIGDWVMRVFGGMHLRATAARVAGPSAVEGLARMQADETRHRGFLPAVLSSLRHALREDQADLHRRIAAHDIPVLAIWGEADTAIPIAALGRLAQINRAAMQVSLPGVGHGLPHTHPREVQQALQQFLRET